MTSINKKELLMIDLCSGLGGASHAMKNHGWNVITVDIEPSFCPDIVADVRKWSWNGDRPDLIWASPPCADFSRMYLPWIKSKREPDLSILMGCIRIIKESKPRYWVIENVVGALKYFYPILGKPSAIYRPYYLWGYFPPLPKFPLNYRKKESLGSKQKAERAKIPYQISEALAIAIESQLNIFGDILHVEMA